MASGDQLFAFVPNQHEPPVTDYGTWSLRNSHPVIEFDAATKETVYFSAIMPVDIPAGGVDVKITCMAATATTGTIGWLIAFEHMSDGTDLDADSFDAENTATAVTVPTTSGESFVVTKNVAAADTDAIGAGDAFRLRIARDVATDTASGYAQLLGVEGVEP